MMAPCECLSRKTEGRKKGIMHYEGCPCFDPEYEKLCRAYKQLLTAYKLGRNAPEGAHDIIYRYEVTP